MKKVLIMAVMLLALAACSSNGDQTNQNVNENKQKTEKPKDVEGRKNFGAEHALVTTPQPCVMIATWDKDHNPDVMMAAWAGQLDYNQIVISLSKHKTTDNLELTKAFTVSFADERTVAESDYFGIVSGNDVPDKVAKAGFTITPSPNVDAPIINQYPLTLECKVLYTRKQELSLIPEDIRESNYPQDIDGTNPLANRDPHTAYIGKIVNAYIIQ